MTESHRPADLADELEQRHEVQETGSDQDPIDDELPLEADPADAIDQRRVAPVLDDDETGR